MLIQSDVDDDLLVIEQDEPRSLPGMQGHYTLPVWRDADGNLRQFPCKISKISGQLLTLDASVKGDLGMWVSVHFKTLGKFEGPIVKAQPQGFVMRIVATHDERARLEAKIAWGGKSESNRRRFQRFVPSDPNATMTVADNNVPCQVLDYSVSGAGLSAEITPEIGETIMLGTIIGRVVRHFPGGFAIRFAALQNSTDLEQFIRQRSP